MSTFFTERWSAEGNALTAPLAREIARIGRALNRIRINGNPARVTESGIDLDVRTASQSSFPCVHLFRPTSSTEGDWIIGKVFVFGTELTLSPVEPATITVDATHYRFWVKLTFSDPAAPTAEWGSGTAFPSITSSTEIYLMNDAATTAINTIDTYRCPTPHDIKFEGRYGVAFSTL